MNENLIKTLNEQRGKIVEEQRALVDTAEKRDDSSFSAEERASFDAMNTDLDGLRGRINELVAAEERATADAALEERIAGVTGRTDGGQDQAGTSQRASGPTDGEQLVRLARGEVRSIDLEQRAQTVGIPTATPTAGGNTVPTGFVADLLDYERDMAAIRQTNVRVISTPSGEALEMPKVTGKGSAQITPEAGALPDSDAAFGKVTLNAWKYGRITDVSTELIDDTGVALLAFLAQDMGESVGEASGADFILGDGNDKPSGVLAAASAGITLTGATPTGDELIDLQHSVIAAYRRRGTFVFNDATMAAVRKLKADGQYLWQPGLVAGEPDRILGNPVVVDHNMPSGTGNRVMLFGDFSKYIIRDVGSVRIERSDDYRFGTDMVSFRVIRRTDGELADTTGAIKAATAA